MKFRIRKQDVEALCRQVPEFETVVRQTKLTSFECVRDLFAALVRSIVAQQLSVKAADAITVRLEKLLGGFEAEKLLEAETADLRACGLSAPKIGYLRGIAEAKRSGRINFRSLARRPDEEILAELEKDTGLIAESRRTACRQELAEILASPRATAMATGFSRRQPSEELCRRCGYAARFSR